MATKSRTLLEIDKFTDVMCSKEFKWKHFSQYNST